jgi:hypothetical protein
VVDGVLEKHRPVLPYKRGTWGPEHADALIREARPLAQPDARRGHRVTAPDDVGFLVDCDNTLVDNDSAHQTQRG